MIAYRYEPEPYTPPSVYSQPRIDHRRLVADRFRRLWHVVEAVAADPGKNRAELAERFNLSERQMQADLLQIRDVLRLPLVRRQGYRFAGEGWSGGPSPLRVGDVQRVMLALAAQWKASRPGSQRDAVSATMERWAVSLPPHLAPLAGRLVTAVRSRDGVFLALVDALIREQPVRLTFLRDYAPVAVREPILTPELLIPYLDGWCVLGPCAQRDDEPRIWIVEQITAVTAMAGDDRGRLL